MQSGSPVVLPGSWGGSGLPGIGYQRGQMASLIRCLSACNASLCVLPSATFLIEGTAVAALAPDLADRSHVDGVIDPPVAAQRQPVDLLAIPGGHLDGGGAVPGGEVAPAREPEHLARVADHGAGDHRTDTEQAGQAGARGPDCGCARCTCSSALRYPPAAGVCVA
jgi:hypothetical protein